MWTCVGYQSWAPAVLSRSKFDNLTLGFDVSPRLLQAQRCDVPRFMAVKLLHLIAYQAPKESGLQFSKNMMANLGQQTGSLICTTIWAHPNQE